MTTPTQLGPKGPAWRAAEEYGFDMSLVESNLRKTPAERIHAACKAMSLAAELRRAMEKRRG
jgi:hypothetical protein